MIWTPYPNAYGVTWQGNSHPIPRMDATPAPIPSTPCSAITTAGGASMGRWIAWWGSQGVVSIQGQGMTRMADIKLPPNPFARNPDNTRFLPCEDCGGAGWIENEFWHGMTPCTNPQCQDGL